MLTDRMRDLPLYEYLDLVNRLEVYVLCYHLRHDRKGWPTVRDAARVLELWVREVEQLVDDSDDLFRTYYPITGTPAPGQYYIESFARDLERP